MGKVHLEDDAGNDQKLDELLQKQRESEQRETELREVLRTARLARTEHLAQTSAKAEKLQKEIGKLQALATAQHDQIAAMSVADIAAENARHVAAMTALRDEIKSLTKGNVDTTKSHQKDEVDTKRRIMRIEDEINKTIGDYDYNMLEKTGAYNALHEQFTAESDSLRRVTEQSNALIKEREEWEAAKAEEKRIRDEIFFKRTRAAVKIQALFRGWLCRKQIADAKNKGKKGKKGGKATKKK